MKYVKAEEGSKNSVIYFDEEGNKLIRHWKKYEDEPVDQASTRSWRNNNPGNHALGPFARKNGAIGGAGKIPNPENKDLKFAVYPDYATGRKAQAKRLKEGSMYIDETLNNFVRKYTGVKRGEPDTQEVINYRKAKRGRDVLTRCSTFLICSAGGMSSGGVPLILAIASLTSFPTVSWASIASRGFLIWSRLSFSCV